MIIFDITLGVFPVNQREAEIIPSVPDAAHTAGGKSY